VITIPELLETLAVQTKDGDNYGDSLIQQLRAARYSSTGNARVGSTAAASERSTLNLSADILWIEVTENIAGYYSAAVDEVQLRLVRKLPEHFLQGWGYAVLARLARHDDTPDVEAAIAAGTVEKLTDMAQAIRDLLDPITGVLRITCPVCGLAQVEVGDGELRAMTATIVRASRPGEELVVLCRNPACNGQWVGDQAAIQLGRQTNQVIDPEKIREARSAQPEWVETEPRRFESFDPANPDHAALRKTVA